jgi:hypothetical protein
MSTLTQSLFRLTRKIFHREDLVPVGGIPYVLGQGLDVPSIEARLTVHWHPPFSTIATEEKPVEKHRFRTFLAKLGIRKKTA